MSIEKRYPRDTRIKAINPASGDYEAATVTGWWSEGMRTSELYSTGPRAIFDSHPDAKNPNLTARVRGSVDIATWTIKEIQCPTKKKSP